MVGRGKGGKFASVPQSHYCKERKGGIAELTECQRSQIRLHKILLNHFFFNTKTKMLLYPV